MSVNSEYARNAADIILSKGSARADAQRQSGELWGKTIATLGDAIPQQVQKAMKAHAEARKQKHIQDVFTEHGTDFDKAIPKLLQIDPELGMEVGKRWNDAQKAAYDFKLKKWELENHERETVASLVASSKDQNSYAQNLVTAKLMGFDVAQFPPEYNPQVIEGLNRSLMTAKERAELDKPQEPKFFNLSPGGMVVDSAGKTIAQNPTVPKGTAPNVGSFEDFVTRKFGERPTADQILTARKDYNQVDDRPQQVMPIVIQGAQGPMLLDRGRNTATPVLDTQGSPVGPAPTAQERNTAQSYAKAKPILTAISELSEQINTGQGVMAKIAGGVERAKAQANLNDDVAEYEALISGFTPLIARALGHTGVLTDQDVQSVKAMFPRPGDSKSLRDRKVTRIEGLMGAIEGAGGVPSTSAPGMSIGVPKEGETKPISGHPGTEQTYRNGKWIRTK